MDCILKTLHLVRQHADDLAWRAIRLSADKGEAKVILLEDAGADEPLPGIDTVSCPPVEYDEIVELLAWADKVVVW
jgi:hypothetical protein